MSTSSGSYRESNYSVKHVETIASGADVRVRLFTLAPGEIIPWHYHSQSSDNYFVLEGALTVRTRYPEQLSVVEVGGSYRLPPQTAHQISNQSTRDCRFLLVQGVGILDWVRSDERR